MLFVTLIVTDCVSEVPPVPVHEPVIVVVEVRAPVDTLVPEVPDCHDDPPFFILQAVALFEVQVIFDEPPEVTVVGEAERLKVGNVPLGLLMVTGIGVVDTGG